MAADEHQKVELTEFEVAVLEAICFGTESSTVAEGLQKIRDENLWADLMGIVNEPRVIGFLASDVTRAQVEEIASKNLSFEPRPNGKENQDG